MIEFGFSSVVNEMVAVSFEINGVAVRTRAVRSQSAEGEGPDAIVMKSIAGRDNINPRVQCSIVDDGRPIFWPQETLPSMPALSSLKVSHADPFGEGDFVIEE